MSILDKLIAVETHQQRMSDMEPMQMFEVSVKQADPDAIGSIVTQFEFILTGKIAVQFWCNKAQYDSALKNAEKLLLLRLYGDILPLIAECKSAIFARSAKDALNILDKMEKEILP